MQNVNRKFRIWGVLLLLMFFAAGVFRYSAANVQAATQTGFVTINGKSYYINKDGSKQKGWLELDGKKYYFNASTGVQVKGWATDSSGRKRYFSKGAGIMMTGWLTDSKDQKRYFDPTTGFMQTRWLTLKGKKYYFYSGSGVAACKTFLTDSKDNTRYFTSACYMLTGWAKNSNQESRYFETSDGIMAKGFQTIGNKTYYFNTNNGKMVTGWKTISSSKYYFDKETGVMATGDVTIDPATPFHDYTVSFLAYIMWDPVHMYNAVVNDWKDVEHQITFDVRQPKTHKFSMERLRKFCKANPHVNVIRYTTFFHQFTLVFDELAREKYVDWYGYSASVSPYILDQFEKEVGYKFRPEYIIDQGYFNNQYRIPSKEFKDFQAFQRREVAKLAKEMVDITHEEGKEAMMFLGDHWIGTEPFMDEFKTIGLDALVGSVGNGSTLRLISDVEGVKYREGRFLPYFFPDTFHEGGDPVKEAKENWVTARRAILRKPIDRIGYGGYLKLA